MILLGSTQDERAMLSLQLVCRSWKAAADEEMWRDLLLSLCGPEITKLAHKLNQLRTSHSQNVAHKDMCLNCAFFGDEAVVLDMGRGYAKYGLAGLDALFTPDPLVAQLCTPNADCEQYELMSYIEQQLGIKDISDKTVVVTLPFKFGLAGPGQRPLDHYHVREAYAPLADKCRSLFFIESAACVLLAHGLVTGVVVSIGFAETFVVVVVKGRVLKTVKGPVGGMRLTQFMSQLVHQDNEEQAEGLNMRRVENAIDLPFITYCRNLKERYCHVLPTPEAHETHQCAHQIQVTPPGEEGEEEGLALQLTTACHRCPEILFRGPDGLGSLVWRAVEAGLYRLEEEEEEEWKAEAEAGESRTAALLKELLGSIVLNGGSSRMPGLGERLRYEVCQTATDRGDEDAMAVQDKVRVIGGTTGDKGPWQGAVRFALANSQIRAGSAIPQCLLVHQCGASGCSRHQKLNGGALQVCSRCRSVRYCCAEHQKEHWKEHKAVCQAKMASPRGRSSPKSLRISEAEDFNGGQAAAGL